MFCMYCGKQIDGSKRFCVFCGGETSKMTVPDTRSALAPAIRAAQPRKKLPLWTVILVAVGCVAFIALASFSKSILSNADKSIAAQKQKDAKAEKERSKAGGEVIGILIEKDIVKEASCDPVPEVYLYDHIWLGQDVKNKTFIINSMEAWCGSSYVLVKGFQSGRTLAERGAGGTKFY